MNIFVTDKDPAIAAQNLDDKRVVKMVLESAQLLSNAMLHFTGSAPYRKTHWNHPCSVIIRENTATLDWLYQHFYYLCKEYTHRYGKIHKCEGYIETFEKFTFDVKTNDLPKFVNCCTNHKHVEDVINAYRMEMDFKWKNDKRMPTWTNRSKPVWSLN